MTNKFNLSKEENIFLAKRNVVDTIWKSALLEGINVTFPQTYSILEKAKVINVDVEDILKITNLKHAWEYVFIHIDDELNLKFICTINAEVARDEALCWGQLRNGEVGIGGTSYLPPIPTEKTADDIIKKCSDNSRSETENSIELMLMLMRSQLFWDGNKRTAMLVANHKMIANGCGIISVKPDNLTRFNELLCDYYTTDKIDMIKQFIYDKCISGISFQRNQVVEQKNSRGR